MVSYAPYWRDRIGWVEAANILNRGVTITCDVAFASLFVDAGNPGAEIHVGEWEPVIGVRRAKGLLTAWHDLVNEVMPAFGLTTLWTKFPDHMEKGMRFVEKLGFERCGLLPCDGTWGGEPHDAIVYSYSREVAP